MTDIFVGEGVVLKETLGVEGGGGRVVGEEPILIIMLEL